MILAAALAVAIFGNYKRGRELDRICDLTGPHDTMAAVPHTARYEIDDICINREPDDEPVLDEP
jgi:hypothetical protein